MPDQALWQRVIPHSTQPLAQRLQHRFDVPGFDADDDGFTDIRQQLDLRSDALFAKQSLRVFQEPARAREP